MKHTEFILQNPFGLMRVVSLRIPRKIKKHIKNKLDKGEAELYFHKKHYVGNGYFSEWIKN